MTGAILSLLLLMEFRAAAPGYRYEFPRDHFNHPEFRTEWWYYTGNLRAADGRRFGFELTFFRHAPDERPKTESLWSVSDAWLAHLALSDIDGKAFHHAERLNRAGPGLAGASLDERRVWNGNWEVRWQGDVQHLQAIDRKFTLRLRLRSRKTPVVHGVNGVSRKAAGAGRASHYVSLTRLEADGALTLDGQTLNVEGSAWMDHEFFTHQLTAEQTGWDWMSLQLADGAELMVFRLRRKDGSVDPYSAGTYVDREGRARHLKSSEFQMTPGRVWKSETTGAAYPVEWKVRVPAIGLDLDVSTPLDKQELVSENRLSPTYWEGAMRAAGRAGGRSMQGVGYLEMTGYQLTSREFNVLR